MSIISAEFTDDKYVSDSDGFTHSGGKQKMKRKGNGGNSGKKQKRICRTINSPHGALISSSQSADGGKRRSLRRIVKRLGLDVASGDEHIKIIDNACDHRVYYTALSIMSFHGPLNFLR